MIPTSWHANKRDRHGNDMTAGQPINTGGVCENTVFSCRFPVIPWLRQLDGTALDDYVEYQPDGILSGKVVMTGDHRENADEGFRPLDGGE